MSTAGPNDTMDKSCVMMQLSAVHSVVVSNRLTIT